MSVRDMTEPQFRVHYAKLNDTAKAEALAEWSKGPTTLRHQGPERVPLPPRADPVPAPEPADPEWSTDWLPEPVRNWVEAVHLTFAVPRVMPIAVALCAAATLAQGKARVRIKPGWEEPLCIFWACAAPTGSRKSAVLTAGTRYIRTIQQHAEESIAETRRAKEARLKHAQAQQRALNAKVKYHDRRDGMQAPISFQLGEDNPAESLREIEADIRALTQHRTESREPGIPSAPRWLREDINPTVIPGVMRANYEAEGIARMAILEGEGTFLQNAMGRHTNSQPAVEPLLKAYQGEPLELTRRAPNSPELVEVSLPACYLTMLTLVQPHVLSKLLSTGELAENGLLGRCIATALPSTPKLPPLDAPMIPEAVQAAYDAWLWSIHQTEVGTVVDLSPYIEPGMPLYELYGMVSKHIEQDIGATGWSIRSVGRVARIFALLSLGSTSTVRLSDVSASQPTHGTLTRGVYILNTLVYLLYLQGLKTASLTEPATGTLTTLCHRARVWLGRSDGLTVGQCFTIRQLQRALTISRASADSILDELLADLTVERVSETRNANKTVTATYRLMQRNQTPAKRASDSGPESEPEPPEGWTDPDDLGDIVGGEFT